MKPSRTRIKICGITCAEDALCAADAGADALGFVFWSRSPRSVELEQARDILQELPPFITKVALFVNAEEAWITEVCRTLPVDVLQFHGAESAEECERYGKPWVKAVPMKEAGDLQQAVRDFPGARALVPDYCDPQRHGGTGRSFDWSTIPDTISKPVILAGGLNAGNVAAAIRQVRPWAVDVSSGVESAPGRKDPKKMQEFIQTVWTT